MIQPANLLLIDINILGFGSMKERAYRDYCFQGRSVGAMAGVLNKLLPLLASHSGYVPVVLWDDRCYWREAILPAYKMHRWQSPEQHSLLRNYLAQTVAIRQMVKHLGILQIACPGFEADDLAGWICRGVDPSWNVLLVTSDTDWYQALQENVSWLSLRSGLRIDMCDLADPRKVKDGPFDSPQHFVFAKALAGDPSDGIPGVRGVGMKTAARIIRDHGSAEALWEDFDSGIAVTGATKVRMAGHEFREVYRRNLMLIDWGLAPPLPSSYELAIGRPDRRGFYSLCAASGLAAPQYAPIDPPLRSQVDTVAETINAILRSASCHQSE